jgi:DNA-binding PadR family transcriptional regulator
LRSNVARSNVAGVSDDGSLRRPNDPPVLILTSLADGPKHGHALAKDIEQFAGVTLGPGALYGAITRLEERGLIEALPSDDRRRPYRITAAGSAALMAAVADMRRLADVGAKRLARPATRRRRLA